jgi:hypothetical protein
MKRSAFAKLGDAFAQQVKVVEVEKVVYRRDVIMPRRPRPDRSIEKAQAAGDFIRAMRTLADFESQMANVEMHRRNHSLAKTIEALKLFEQEYSHCRFIVGSLPACTESDCMMAVVEACDAKAKRAWQWVIKRAAELDAPRENKAARQRRRRNKNR